MANKMKVNELIKLEDVNLKMTLARNIINAVELEKTRGIDPKDETKAFSHAHSRCYGYLCYKNYDYFKRMMSTTNHCKTFLNFIEERETPLNFSFSDMRDLILAQYNKHIIPTKPFIIEIMRASSVIMPEKNFDSFLEQAGFTWRQIPNTAKAIIVEKEEHVFKRQRYLQKMKQYRQRGRQIVYIEESILRLHDFSSCIEPRPNANQKLLIAASPQLGLINLHFTTDLDDQTVQKWIYDVVASTLQPSVIVYNETLDRTNDRALTVYDSKSEMIKWLNKNNVPCDSSMHKADLYALIKRLHPKPKPLYHIEEGLKIYGHDVLLLPNGLPSLSFFNNFWDTFRKFFYTPQKLDNNVIKEALTQFVEKYTVNKWKKLDELLTFNEYKIYNEDMKLEELTDKLLTQAKYPNDYNNIEFDIFDDYQPDILKETIIA